MKGFADSCDHSCHLASSRVCAEPKARALQDLHDVRRVLKGPTSVIQGVACICVRVKGFVNFLLRCHPATYRSVLSLVLTADLSGSANVIVPAADASPSQKGILIAPPLLEQVTMVTMVLECWLGEV
jgi:hypothetical protein